MDNVQGVHGFSGHSTDGKPLVICCYTAPFVLDLVRNRKDVFSYNTVQLISSHTVPSTSCRYLGYIPSSVIISGCPFTQTVEDGGMPTASGGGLYFAEEDKPAVFTVDVGRRKGDLGVHVQGTVYYAPNFEKVGSILVSACPCVCVCVRPSVRSKKKIKLGF